MTNCLFCKIASKEIPADIVFEDSKVVAFKDIDPKAPHHVLIVPRKHIETINDVTTHDTSLIAHIIQIAKNLAAELEIAESGYRILFNCNEQGGQAVYHIHLHLLGGRQMAWPPG